MPPGPCPRLPRQQRPVVIHRARMARTTDGRGAVGDLTRAGPAGGRRRLRRPSSATGRRTGVIGLTGIPCGGGSLPEWPDLAVVRRRLQAALAGSAVTGAEELRPLVLRLPVSGPLPRVLVGRRVSGVAVRGKFLTLGFDDGAALVVNPMLAGVLALARRREAAVRLEFEGDRVLDYVDPKAMGKVYYLPPPADPARTVPGYAAMGPDPPGAHGGAEGFAAHGRRRRCEVRNLLLDPTFVAGIGNAYADEILWSARLHPKRRVGSLDADEWRRLYQSLQSVLAAAETAVDARLPAEMGVEVRDHLQVRGRAGRPCPRCGARIVRRHLGYLETDLCPRCQPDPGGAFPLPQAGQGW